MLTLPGLATNVPAVTPAPANAMLTLAVSPTIATEPVTAPVACGLNVTFRVALWPAARLAGAVRPLTANPVPLALTSEMLMPDVPALLTFTAKLCVLPISTFPNVRLGGFAVNMPEATPVPARGKVTAGLEASLVIERDPLAAPVASGEKINETVALWPAARVVGRVMPEKANPLPDAAACDIVRATPPVLLTVAAIFFVVPTGTFPKFMLAGETSSWPAIEPPFEGFGFALTPWQPDSVTSSNPTTAS